MGPLGIGKRDEGLRQVGRVTGWLAAGAVALTALVTAIAAGAAPGGGSRSTQPQVSTHAAAPSVNPTPSGPSTANDPGLEPIPAPTPRSAPPQRSVPLPDTSSRGS